jgi:hypothetical protein
LEQFGENVRAARSLMSAKRFSEWLRRTLNAAAKKALRAR